MDTLIVSIDPNNITAEDEKMFEKAGEIIKAGGLVAFPTETVYGLGGDALNSNSSKKIYAAKGRPSDNPLIVHISSFDQLYKIVADIPDSARALAETFWPGPLTMIFKKSDAVPYETTGGLDTVAVRMPDHQVALRFIETAGGYIAAPSANLSGRPSPSLASHVIQDMNCRINMIIDGGQVGIGVESTIVDMTSDVPTILRPGYITERMLEAVLGQIDVDKTILSADTGLKPKAPGMKYRHYAPMGQMTIVEGDEDKVVTLINGKIAEARAEGKKTGVICTDETYDKVDADVKLSLGPRADDAEKARRLYKVLRDFDDQKVEVIYSESFSDQGFGQAVMNRLLKAAGFTVAHIK